MKTTLINYVHHPYDPQANFALGKKYEDVGQNSAAIAYYLRTAEFTSNKLLSYECLCRMAVCMERLGNRCHSTKGILLRAISLMPERPEAYWLLVKVYEKTQEWPECYALSCTAEALTHKDSELKTDVSYPGAFAFKFQKALSSWWIGLFAYSIRLFKELKEVPGLPYEYSEAVLRNLKNLGNGSKKITKYEQSHYQDLRFKFPGADMIVDNFSHAFQDMFVLTMLKGKQNGKFLEIGCGDPWWGNNTFLLERHYGWNGISIDISKELTDRFALYRKAKIIQGDATMIDYGNLLEGDYDYLQLDCEPADTTFKALQRIPLQFHKFAVITFEHDWFADDNKAVREESRRYLRSYGYQLVVPNISLDWWGEFEDWWVHPDLVDSEIIKRMTICSDTSVPADRYMYDRLNT